jgi:hypothetical protein
LERLLLLVVVEVEEVMMAEPTETGLTGESAQPMVTARLVAEGQALVLTVTMALVAAAVETVALV